MPFFFQEVGDSQKASPFSPPKTILPWLRAAAAGNASIYHAFMALSSFSLQRAGEEGEDATASAADCYFLTSK